MRLVIAGSRDFDDYSFIESSLRQFEGKVTEVVSGGCQGVDTLGELWAVKRSLPVKRFPADWKKHGRSAGPKRNAEMAKYGDALAAFVTSTSKGTLDMIRKMDEQLKYVYCFYPEEAA